MAADKLNVIAPYIAIAATGLPAAARSGGVLRWYLLWDVLVTCALKLTFIHFQHWDEHAHRMVWPLYYPLWLRAYLMFFQSACYLALAVAERFLKFPIAKV